jgi:CTP synthase (UTP-ammonia lyase)
MARVLIVGEFNPEFVPHQKTDAALVHSARLINVSLEAKWISTAKIDEESLQAADGFVVAPGSPYRSMEGALAAIRFAREPGVPLLGTCGGFQHLIIEYARNVLGFADAQHAEYDPNASQLFIHRLECSLVGRALEVRLAADSLARRLYGTATAIEQYYCNFGVNPAYVEPLSSSALRIAGSDDEGEIRVVELPDHPFFVGTLFVPQLLSTEGKPHPLVTGLVRAAAER